MGGKVNSAARAGLLLGDGRDLHAFTRNSPHNILDSPQQHLGTIFCARVMQGRADAWLRLNGAVLLHSQGFADSLWTGRALLQLGVSVCVFADVNGEGAPCSQWCQRQSCALGACGGGWWGSWWGRRRRRQRVEEGRDVSGKSWVGSTMA